MRQLRLLLVLATAISLTLVTTAAASADPSPDPTGVTDSRASAAAPKRSTVDTRLTLPRPQAPRAETAHAAKAKKAKKAKITKKGGKNAKSSRVVGKKKGTWRFLVKKNAKGYWTIVGNGGDTLNLGAVKKKVTLDLSKSKKHQKVLPGLFLRVKDRFSLVRGGAKADEIRGSKASEMIDGRKGNDTIGGAAGHDTLLGGLGNDSLKWPRERLGRQRRQHRPRGRVRRPG